MQGTEMSFWVIKGICDSEENWKFGQLDKKAFYPIQKFFTLLFSIWILTRQRHNFFWCLSSKGKMRCVFEKFPHLCDYVLNLTCFEQEKNFSLFLALSIIVKMNAKNDQKVLWSNFHIYVNTSWIWTCFDAFFESKFRICNTILKIFWISNHILMVKWYSAWFNLKVINSHARI